MTTLSIRKLPLELEKAIQREAKKRKTSKTKVVIDALKDAFHLEKSSPKVKRDIRSFFGKMTPQEMTEFKKQTADFSKVDQEIWK